MDFLGSIMGSMDKAKPAPPSEKEKMIKKKQKVAILLSLSNIFFSGIYCQS